MLKLKIITDDRGDLMPVEFKDLPFIPQRIFIVKNVPIGLRRGEHAHYKTQQLLVCLKGHIKVVLDDGLQKKSTFISESETILIPQLIWDYQEFTTEQDVLLVICSTPFDLNDYITDFNEFEKTVKDIKK
jgi:UDP-2-acetamido-3-amino-2,3-dideoxy-glucuronate N-acetyltransferase